MIADPPFTYTAPTIPISPVAQPDDFPIPLRPYQSEGVRFIDSINRGMLTYQPGLGKTEAAIAACIEYDPTTKQWRPPSPVIICAPSYLGDLWFDRILQYLPYARVVLASGARSTRERVLKLRADWYIINYEMLHKRTTQSQQRRTLNAQDTQRNRATRKPYDFPNAGTWIFDESHHLKNPNGKQSQAAAEVTSDPNTRVIMLTGTPIKRDPDDLYMQLHILHPHEDYNRIQPELYHPYYERFIKQYCIYLPNPYGGRVFGARRTPIENLMQSVAHHVSYEDAGIYRPEIQPTTIRITLDPRNREGYDEIERTYAYKDFRMYSAIEVMHALRIMTACPSKIKAVQNLAEQFESMIVFTTYVYSAKMLAEALSQALGKSVPYIAGTQETSPKDRQRILSSQPTHLVGTLGSISEGVDLSYMKAVVFFEETWTPLEIEQATDRVRRFGNKASKINSYYLLGRNTIDETIHSVMSNRGMTAETIVRRRFEQVRRQNPQPLELT